MNSLLYGSKVEDNPVYKCHNPQILLTGISHGQQTSFGMGKEELSRHILLLGATGSGKTNTINQIVKQIKTNLNPDDVMLIFDTKGDYYNNFFSSNDIVISNQDNFRNLAVWNIYKEIVADGWDDKKIIQNANEISFSLFKEAIEKTNQTFFPNAARDLFASILIGHIRLGRDDQKFKTDFFNNEALKFYLDSLNIEKLNQLLGVFPDLTSVLTYLGDGYNDQSLGVLAELQNTIRKIFIGNFIENGRFSIRQFIRNRGAKTLFIEYDLSLGQTLLPIYRLLFDLALKEALGRNTFKGNVYIICDEFKLLPNLNYIEDAVNFGRSLGVKIIAGIQSVDQLYHIYGTSKARSIMSGFSTMISFRTNDYKSREYISNLYGKNIQLDNYIGMDGNITEDKRTGQVVEDWCLQDLEIGEAVVSLPFSLPFIFKFNRF